jgi:hypothetical protein
MTESQFTAKLKKDLETVTGGHAIKHCDQYTGGIPDLTVTVRGVTTWIEVKEGDNRATPLQLWTMGRLGRALCVTWRGTIKRGEGWITWRGTDPIVGEMPYRELVLHVAKICMEEHYGR